MEPARLFAVIKSRRTVRKVGDRPISRRVITRMLSAATYAPSAHNAQPWRFIVVENRCNKRKMLLSMGDAWKQDLRADGRSRGVIESLVDSSMKRFVRTALIVVVAVTMEDMDKHPDERRKGAERIMAIQSASAAIQNMLLMAHVSGLGAAWSCAPLFAPEVVKKSLGIEEKWEPIAMIAFGLPKQRPKAPPRKTLGEVTIWI